MMTCDRVEERLVFYFYDELEAAERAALEEHLGVCARCAHAAEEMKRLRGVLDQRPAREASPALFVRCREALEDALDREAQSWRALVRSWFVVPPGVTALRATSALVILIVGLSLGWTVRARWDSAGPAGSPAPGQAWVGADLSDLRIRGISQITPDPQTGQVQVTLEAERQVTLEGSLDDPRIRQVLLYAVKDHANPGIRRDTLEVLRGRGDNPTVREALLYALRNDPNAGVRLQALEALESMSWGPDIEQALVAALRGDTNPGVRVAAISLLVDHADDEMLPVFEELAQKDSNAYVRMQCAQAALQRARVQR